LDVILSILLKRLLQHTYKTFFGALDVIFSILLKRLLQHTYKTFFGALDVILSILLKRLLQHTYKTFFGALDVIFSILLKRLLQHTYKTFFGALDVILSILLKHLLQHTYKMTGCFQNIASNHLDLPLTHKCAIHALVSTLISLIAHVCEIQALQQYALEVRTRDTGGHWFGYVYTKKIRGFCVKLL